MVHRMFWGAVMVTAAVFAAIFAQSGEAVLAALSVGIGALWIAVDRKSGSELGTLFFLPLVVLAVIAGVNDAPLPLTLLGLTAALAAWDLAQLRARLADETDPGRRAPVEAQHVRVLAVTLAIGFLVALLPSVVRFSLPFVGVVLIGLLALLALRFAVRVLRPVPQPPGERRSEKS